jgi:hypothetical protein
MKTEFKYRDHTIKKIRFTHGRILDGGRFNEGWLIIDEKGCNACPGAGWFATVARAERGIDALILAGDDAKLFHNLLNATPDMILALVEALRKTEPHEDVEETVSWEETEIRMALDEFTGTVVRCEECRELLYSIGDHAEGCLLSNTMVTRGV